MRKPKPQPRRQPKKRPVLNFVRRWMRFFARMPWPAWALVACAAISLVTVESSVVGVIFEMTSDPVTAVIFVSIAAMASLGVCLGPAAIRLVRDREQRNLAIKIVWTCFALAIWNLAVVLANGEAQQAAHAIRSAPTYDTEVARLSRLNARIDGAADERDDYALANYTAERDRLQERIDAANPKPIMFPWENGGILYWIKALVFHALIAGFSAAFAIQMRPARRASKRTRKTADVYLFGKSQAA